MPGVTTRLMPRASAAFMDDTVVPGVTIRKSLSGRDTPRGGAALHVVPSARERNAGTNTDHASRRSTTRKGFSRITGAAPIVVYGGSGKIVAGAPCVPTKTMFQFAPVQRPSVLLRVSHCCWLPDLTSPSTFESASNPTIGQPP